MSILTQAEIAAQLQAYITSTITDTDVDVTPDTSFQTLGIDSMAIIELVLFIERKFDITLPEAELTPANFKSASTLAACAFRYKNHKPK